ncbi:GNAT family N-acetyltransferase [Paludibaculum fermentans]|uniref:GNAT family N-acetyltransferase n=1 Tax=Paludibaculum fermentans TaxID=1473598 RepID=A0A7S7SJQ0_PALFE|nr:GNAT family N-acetyltransferase [Paludibaculum fermentans]QOY87474.1 GNAT family N-acetyltransferase [Paludibaculum fermentans]
MDLHVAETAADFEIARELFREYAQTPGVSVCVVGFEEELSSLETAYEAVVLAVHEGSAVGCGAMRPLGGGSAEMKRLYVRPFFRGLKAGRAMAEWLIEAARSRGYSALRLDTLPSMEAAQSLYRALGFQVIPPYSQANPAEAICYELWLRAAE